MEQAKIHAQNILNKVGEVKPDVIGLVKETALPALNYAGESILAGIPKGEDVPISQLEERIKAALNDKPKVTFVQKGLNWLFAKALSYGLDVSAFGIAKLWAGVQASNGKTHTQAEIVQNGRALFSWFVSLFNPQQPNTSPAVA